MAEDIKSPVFPESVFEGTLSNWLKKEGESFKQDEILAEIDEEMEKDNLNEDEATDKEEEGYLDGKEDGEEEEKEDMEDEEGGSRF